MSMRLNRSAYAKLVAEDAAWLEKMPRTLERDHILLILRCAVAYEYGPFERGETYPEPAAPDTEGR
jgi:hypothetical protein